MRLINTLMDSNRDFEETLSFEVRFVVARDGKILKANPNGRALMNDNRKNFFDLLIPTHRSLAQAFFQGLTPNAPEEIRLTHVGYNARIPYNYRGILRENVYVLAARAVEEPGAVPACFHPLLNALTVGVLELDHNNHIVYKNDIYSNFVRRFADKDQESSVPGFMLEMADDVRMDKKDVQRFHLLEDPFIRIYGLYNDREDTVIFVMDNRASAEEYQELVRHKQQMDSVSYLAAGFAHELRNPLSVIRGFVQLAGLTNDMNKYAPTILTEIDRMNRIIEEFLSLSRKKLEKASYEPQAFFLTLVSFIQSECLLRKVRFVHSFDRTSRTLSLNHSMIKQVVLNIFRNAMEAFPSAQPDKCFTIRGRAHNNGYTVLFSDNGPGIAKEVLDQIGKPYFTTKANGTGIGLSLCKKIINDHDGRFVIESEPGQGTTILIEFPYETGER